MECFSHTPVTQHSFNGILFYLKRDDLLHPDFSGNKARKLMALMETPYPEISHLLAYGSAQANSLVSFAALAKLRGWQLEFYVDHIPSWLKANPVGNYARALQLGAKLIETRDSGLHPRDYIAQIRVPSDNCLFVPEGGRSPIAKQGVTALANEILDWQKQNNIENLVVALPSGTGTTAHYLHQTLKHTDIELLTCACVSDLDYLKLQMRELGATGYPTILGSAKHHFGKLYRYEYLLWQSLCKQTGVEFELLYDPWMWTNLLKHQEMLQNRTLLYIHQGGVLGNGSMQRRYMRKWPELMPNG